jgi:hypothetical protein
VHLSVYGADAVQVGGLIKVIGYGSLDPTVSLVISMRIQVDASPSLSSIFPNLWGKLHIQTINLSSFYK